MVTLKWTCPLRASVGHGADRRARYELGVLRQHAGSVARRSRLPRGPAALELGVLDLEPDQVLVGVDRDEVTLLHQGDRPAHGRLGRDVPDDEAVRAAGEAPVG